MLIEAFERSGARVGRRSSLLDVTSVHYTSGISPRLTSTSTVETPVKTLVLPAGLDGDLEDVVGQAFDPEVAVGVGLDRGRAALGTLQGDGGADDDFFFDRVVHGAADELLGQVEVVDPGLDLVFELGSPHAGLLEQRFGLVLVHELKAHGGAGIGAAGLFPTVV